MGVIVLKRNKTRTGAFMGAGGIKKQIISLFFSSLNSQLSCRRPTNQEKAPDFRGFLILHFQ